MTGSNAREQLVTNLNLDILCLCETFVVGKQEVQLNNYIWYGNTRKTISRRAVRGSGGVGILVHRSILQHFTIQVLDNSFEDILWVQIMDNNGSCVTCVCVCYLSPANSSRGDRSTEFFDCLKTQIMDFIVMATSLYVATSMLELVPYLTLEIVSTSRPKRTYRQICQFTW